MAAINPHLTLSALNHVVRGHTSSDALYEINSASPSEINWPSIGHQVRDTDRVWVNYSLSFQEWQFEDNLNAAIEDPNSVYEV